jgi:hypothetical protein
MPLVEIHLHVKTDVEVLRRLSAHNQKLDLILNNQENIMPTLEELQAKADATLAAVTAETDLNNAIAKVVNDQRATITDLKAQLAAAGTDPVKLQALSDTLDAILSADTANDQIVSDAITANTPAA